MLLFNLRYWVLYNILVVCTIQYTKYFVLLVTFLYLTCNYIVTKVYSYGSFYCKQSPKWNNDVSSDMYFKSMMIKHANHEVFM
jgi:hypothetical protein